MNPVLDRGGQMTDSSRKSIESESTVRREGGAMKGYFKSLLIDPLKTSDDAAKAIRFASYGFYSIGCVPLIETIIRAFLFKFQIIDSYPELTSMNLIFSVLFIFILAYYLSLTKRPIFAWIMLIIFAPDSIGVATLFLGNEIDTRDHFRMIVLGYKLIYYTCGVVFGYSGIRATRRFRELMRGER